VTGIVAAKLSQGTLSGTTLTMGTDKCMYLPDKTEAGDDPGSYEPCSTYMQTFITSEAKTENNLKKRTPTATVTKSGTGSDTSYTQEDVSDTTTKFAQWDYSGETEFRRRSLLSAGNETAVERRTLTAAFKNSDSAEIDDDFLPVLVKTHGWRGRGVQQDDVGQRCFSDDQNDLESEVALKSGQPGGCFDIPLSIVVAKVKTDDKFMRDLGGEFLDRLAGGDTDIAGSTALKGRVYLAFETQATHYNSQKGKYTYHTKLVLPRGCYAPVLRRHISAFKTYVMGELQTHDGYATMFFGNYNPKCKYEVSVTSAGSDYTDVGV